MMAKHVVSTVLFTAAETSVHVDLMFFLAQHIDPSVNSLQLPYSDLIWVADDTPCSAVVMRHDLGDGTYYHSLAMAHKGIDYLIHNRDLLSGKVKSTDELADMVRLQLGQGIEDETR